MIKLIVLTTLIITLIIVACKANDGLTACSAWTGAFVTGILLGAVIADRRSKKSEQ